MNTAEVVSRFDVVAVQEAKNSLEALRHMKVLGPNWDPSLTEVTEEIRGQATLAVKVEYTFDFLDLGDEHSERQLEAAILGRI